MLQACVRRLQTLWPNADIQVFTHSPERLEQYCAEVSPVAPTIVGRGAASVAPMSFQRTAEQMWKMVMPLLARPKRRSVASGLGSGQWRVLEAVRQADLVVSSGGGFVNDVFWWHGVGVLSVLAMAQRLGKPTAMFGQGIGPLTHPVLTRLVTLIMPRLLVIGLREGSSSIPLLTSHGVERERIQVTGDDSLLLATTVKRPRTGTAIGLNIRVASYSAVDRRVASQAVAVTFQSALRRGVKTLPLPVSRYKASSDLKALRNCGARPGDDAAGREFADIHTPMELAQHAASCRIVVTGSYHAAVFGLAAGVPAVCISNSRYYDLKFKGLGALFPDGCHLVRPGPLFERELSDAIDRAWETSEAGRDCIHSAALAQVAKADQLYTRFKSLVISNRNSVLIGKRSVFQREQAVGMSTSACLAGKVIIYGVAALIQGIAAAITIAAKRSPMCGGVLLWWNSALRSAKLYVLPATTTIASALVPLAMPHFARVTALVRRMGRQKYQQARGTSK
jgi:colanic acid/amylovoran biosynthesis protein